MLPTMIYNGKDPKKRKEARRGNLFVIGEAFIILIAFTIASAILVFLLTASQDDQLEVTFYWLCGFLCWDVGVTLFLTLLIIPTHGRQTMRVDFFDSYFTVDGDGIGGKVTFEFEYQNIEKVYISRLSKLRLWQRYVGHYAVYYEVKKEKRDGRYISHRKRQYREFPPVYSLQEAEKVVAFIEEKRKEIKGLIE